MSFSLHKYKGLTSQLIDSLDRFKKDAEIFHSTLKKLNGPSPTYFHIEFLGISNLPVLNTRAPLVIISFNFASKLKLKQGLDYNRFLVQQERQGYKHWAPTLQSPSMLKRSKQCHQQLYLTFPGTTF